MTAHIYKPRGRRTAGVAALLAGALALPPCLAAHAAAAGRDALVRTIERVKPSIVGIGTYMKTRSPALQFLATGFAVGDGRHVITNAHAVDKLLDVERVETRVVLVAEGDDIRMRNSRIVAMDKDHDLALLAIEGDSLPPLALGDSGEVEEGWMMAFTGFPIGMVLGFHPSTHRVMVAAITPVALPGLTAQQLNPRMVSRIRETPYKVFQLDGTAYPGNSGSPVYDPDSGIVYGVINSTFVQGTRENAIGRPSGISYAIPARHIRELLQAHNIPERK